VLCLYLFHLCYAYRTSVNQALSFIYAYAYARLMLMLRSVLDARSGLRESVLVNRLTICMIFLKCKHKRGLFCQDARWRIFVTWLGQLFIMFTITTLKHLGFYMLTGSSFIFFLLYFDYILSNLLISSSVANNSVCVRLNIVWNRWKSTLKPKPRNKNVKKGTKL